MFIPRSIKYEIASHLDRHDVFNLMRTSKAWHKSLSENYFWEFYLKKICPHNKLTNFLEVYSSYKHLALHLHHSLLTFWDLEIVQPFMVTQYFPKIGILDVATGPDGILAYIHEIWSDDKFAREIVVKKREEIVTRTILGEPAVKIKIHGHTISVIDRKYNLYTLSHFNRYQMTATSESKFTLVTSNVKDFMVTSNKLVYIGTDNNLYSRRDWADRYSKLMAEHVISIAYNNTYLWYLTEDNQIYNLGLRNDKSTKIQTDIAAVKIYMSTYWVGIIDKDNVLHAKHLKKDNWFKVNTNVTDACFTDDLIGMIKESNLYLIDPKLKFVQVHIASNISKISIYDRNNLLAIGYDKNLMPKLMYELMNRAKNPRSYTEIIDYDEQAFTQVIEGGDCLSWVEKYSSNVYGLLQLFDSEGEIDKVLKLVNIDLSEASDVFCCG